MLTFARNSASSTSPAEEAWTEVTSSSRRSWCSACMTRRRSPSLCGHRSSSSASLSMMDTFTSASPAAAGGSPMLLLQQLPLGSAAVPVLYQRARGNRRWYDDLSSSPLRLPAAAAPSPPSGCCRPAELVTRAPGCFTYSIVSGSKPCPSANRREKKRVACCRL